MAMFRRFRRQPGPAAELVIVANRLPVAYSGEDGWVRAPGGLVSAMESVLRDRESTWVGWSGQFAGDDPTAQPLPARVGDIVLVDVPLTEQEVAAHYDGFSNGALWPNYHGGIVAPAYHRSQFMAHRAVNQHFARAVAERAAQGARVWVHDYQLQLVPSMLRALRPDLRIGFFLHIPYPPVEVFGQIPWRSQLVEGLLGADVVGFQTHGDADNFRRAATRFGGEVVLADDLTLLVGDPARSVVADAFPIGIRAQDYQELACRPDVRERAEQIRADVGNPEVLLLGVDRLDYTKGIDVRIQAVTELLLDDELDPRQTAFIQVAPPTRAKVEEYQKIREEVELLVSRANGALGPVGTNPIHYMHQPMPPDELVALYLAADVMLVTPLRDGMNLVAKEYVAARVTETGALVLSEFTGAAEQMTQAWLVNPYDIVGMKRTILAALAEPPALAAARMRALRAGVLGDDVSAWADSFLAALTGSQGDDQVPDDLAEALDRLDPNGPLLVALDFDGTLSHLVAEPSAARPVAGVIDQLAKLAATGADIALVSGRSRDDLVAVSGAEQVAVLIGSHGQESGQDEGLAPLEQDLLDHVADHVSALVAEVPGAWIEDKPNGLAVHVRNCDPTDAQGLVTQLREFAEDRRELHVIEGKLVIELSIRPLDKGSAIRDLIAAAPDRPVLFAGDDVTDELAMSALRPDDISIKVGPEPSVARYRVDDPDAMVAVLEALVAARSIDGSPRGR